MFSNPRSVSFPSFSQCHVTSLTRILPQVRFLFFLDSLSRTGTLVPCSQRPETPTSLCKDISKASFRAARGCLQLNEISCLQIFQGGQVSGCREPTGLSGPGCCGICPGEQSLFTKEVAGAPHVGRLAVTQVPSDFHL